MDGTVESRPVPDPTTLTTDAIRREIVALRELLETKITALADSTDLRFGHAESTRLEQKADTKEMVSAALAAQKEASVKTETTVADQIKQLGANFDAVVKRLDDRIAAVETRVSKTEAAVGA